MPDFKDTKNILLLVIWILAFITAWLTFFVPSVITVGTDRYNLYTDHFVCAAVYANVGISSCILLALFLEEEFPQKTLKIFAICAAIIYLIAGGLYLSSSEPRRAYSDSYYSEDRTTLFLVICNGIFCIALAILHFAFFLTSVLSK